MQRGLQASLSTLRARIRKFLRGKSTKHRIVNREVVLDPKNPSHGHGHMGEWFFGRDRLWGRWLAQAMVFSRAAELFAGSHRVIGSVAQAVRPEDERSGLEKTGRR